MAYGKDYREGQQIRDFLGKNLKVAMYHIKHLKAHYHIDSDMCEELIQEAAIALDYAKKTVNLEKSSLDTWTNICIKNKLRNYMSKYEQNKPSEFNEELYSPENNQRALKDALTDAIQDLLTDIEQRVVVGYYQGNNHKEIAKDNNITEGNSRIILMRAFNKLKEDEILQEFYQHRRTKSWM